MAKMGSEHICSMEKNLKKTKRDWSSVDSSAHQFSFRCRRTSKRFNLYDCTTKIRASQSMEEENKAYKELGMFSLRKKIEDSVLRAETLSLMALELEEEKRVEQEEMIRHCNLWDDLAQSNEILMKLADSSKVVDSLKDLRYKAEEVKLITQLAEMDAINYELFKQAYTASIDVSKFLDEYEMSKLLKQPYDKEGACLMIKAADSGLYSDIWAEQLLLMYMKWAKKQGFGGRVVEKCSTTNGGIMSATIEFESKCAYGYLSGERGVHCMISSSVEASMAAVELIPLFLSTAPKLLINEEDLSISSPSSSVSQSGLKVRVQHIPSGVTIQSSGERNQFANKIKALNRLKAKLLVIMGDQGISDIRNIDKNGIIDIWDIQARRYIFHPHKLVLDVKTGIQVPDLNSVLDGNIEPLIAANINIRQTF